MFSRVWKPDETLALVFEIVLENWQRWKKDLPYTGLLRKDKNGF